MKIFIRFLNGCVMRRQKAMQYKKFFMDCGHELVESAEESDYIIVWGCSFRADWRDSSLTVINYYIDNFKQKIIVTGCLPSIAPEYIVKNERVKLIPWKNDLGFERIFGKKAYLYDYNPVFTEKRICEDTTEYRKTNPDKDVTFHDSFVKIVVAVGCKFHCAYCSEHIAFPKYRSFPEDKIIEECKKIIEETQVYDIMLLADNLGQYGCDVRSSFPRLVKNIKSLHPSIRFAFNNLNPFYFLKFLSDIKFFLKNNWVKHFNLPIQSASDKILKLMNRPYNKKDLVKIFNTLSELEFKDFDTHVIVGFPGETDDDIKETLDFLISVNPRYVLASKYMEAKRATSANLPNKVDAETMKIRVLIVKETLNNAGILCNTDESELSSTRLLNLMKKE